MTTFATTHRATAYCPVFAGVFKQIADTIGVWRQRRHLAALDDAALCDIGLTRTEALREARRPLWDVPQHWRH